MDSVQRNYVDKAIISNILPRQFDQIFPIITLENNEPEHILSIEHLVNSLLKETEQHNEAHQQAVNKVADSQNLVTLMPWLRCTEWPRIFERRDIKDLANLVRLPDKTEI